MPSKSITTQKLSAAFSSRAMLLLILLTLCGTATLAQPDAAKEPLVPPSSQPVVEAPAPESGNGDNPQEDPSKTEATPLKEGDPSATPSPEATPSIEDLYAPDRPQKMPGEKATEASKPTKPKGPVLYITDSDNGRIVVMQGINGEGFTSVGLPGYGYGRFLRPAQIWVDYQDRLYIADSGNNRIVRIDQDSKPGWTEVGNLSEPRGVAVDGSGVYVSDTKADRVVIFDEVVDKAPIREVLTHPQLKRPTDLWIDATGALYICCGEDPPGGRLLKTWTEKGLADKQGEEAKPQRRWTVFQGEGLSGSRFLPASVITGKAGLRLLDVSGQRLVSMQDMTGKRLKEDKFRIDPRWRLSRPTGMAIDHEGRLFLCDSGNDRILELGPDGDVVGEYQIAKDDPGTLLSNPTSIFIFSPAPPPPPKTEDDSKGKGKGKGKEPKKPKGDDLEINSDW